MRVLESDRTAVRTAGLLCLALSLCLTRPVLAQTQPAPSGQDLPSADELVARIIEAVGGREKLESLKNRVTKGNVEFVMQNIKADLTSYEQAPNKSYTLIASEQLGNIERGTNGEVFWEMSAMTGPRLITGPERATALREATFNNILHLKKLYDKIEVTGVADLDGKPAYALKLTPREGTPETWYIDRKTHLPVRADLTVETPMGAMQVKVYSENYRPVDGVQIAHKIRQALQGVDHLVVTLREVQHNVDIPKDRFDLPPAIQELTAQPLEKTEKP